MKLNKALAKSMQFAAIPVGEKIFLFGGNKNASFNMYELDYLGNLVSDLSKL